MKMFLNSKMFFLIGNLLVNMLSGKTLPNINNDAIMEISGDSSSEKNSNCYSESFGKKIYACDDIGSFGIRSLDSNDDNNEYFLGLNTPPDCKTIFIGISASAEDFIKTIKNVTIEIQNGKFNGTATEANNSFENTVLQELPIDIDMPGSMGSVPQLCCYGFRLSSKYPYKDSEFALKLKADCYPIIDNYKKSKDRCKIASKLEISAIALVGVGVVCWCAGMILICRNANIRRDAINRFYRVPSVIYLLLDSDPRRRNGVEIEVNEIKPQASNLMTS